jgi:hypothetical protein
VLNRGDDGTGGKELEAAHETVEEGAADVRMPDDPAAVEASIGVELGAAHSVCAGQLHWPYTVDVTVRYDGPPLLATAPWG